MWPNSQELRIWSHLLKKSLMTFFVQCDSAFTVKSMDWFLYDMDLRYERV